MLVAAAHQAPFRRALRGLIPPRNLIVEPRRAAPRSRSPTAPRSSSAGSATESSRWSRPTITSPTGFAISAHARRRDRSCRGERIDRRDRHHADAARDRLRLSADRCEGRRGISIDKFVEKPPLAIARRMVRSGRYLWNASMFVVSTRTLAREFERTLPGLGIAAEKLARPADDTARAYRTPAFDSFDRVIMEKSANVLSVRARFSWHDVGTWDGLWEAVSRRGRQRDARQRDRARLRAGAGVRIRA